jgi:hypothetical protein
MCELLAAVDHVKEESAVNRTLSQTAQAQILTLPGWKGLDNPWLPEADKNVEYSYINLLVNTERYTGYAVRPPCFVPRMHGMQAVYLFMQEVMNVDLLMYC